MNLINTLQVPYYFFKNRQYDRLTRQVLQQILQPGSHCIDIGCHQGKILDMLLTLSPQGTHRAFEPLPHLYRQLQQRYADQPVSFFPFALSDENGESRFTWVKNAPGYSGFRKRLYHVPFPQTTEILVQKRKLDDLLPPGTRIDFIKLDVEGAEEQVLRGAANTIRNNRPFLLFEHGKGAAPYYQTTPETIFDLLTGYGLRISTLKDWLRNRSTLDRPAFCRQFHRELNYYFIAFPG